MPVPFMAATVESVDRSALAFLRKGLGKPQIFHLPECVLENFFSVKAPKGSLHWKSLGEVKEALNFCASAVDSPPPGMVISHTWRDDNI